jgi:hypothetical protein
MFEILIAGLVKDRPLIIRATSYTEAPDYTSSRLSDYSIVKEPLMTESGPSWLNHLVQTRPKVQQWLFAKAVLKIPLRCELRRFEGTGILSFGPPLSMGVAKIYNRRLSRLNLPRFKAPRPTKGR